FDQAASALSSFFLPLRPHTRVLLSFPTRRSSDLNVLTGFARIEGRSVGIVANQPLAGAGAIDSAAAEKAARFIRTCDAFNTPVVTFLDSLGFLPSVVVEKAGLVRRARKLTYAYAQASVGKITVITRKAFGPAYV